jgi:hypothetical protein
MKVITQPHPYSIWGNVKILEDLEFDVPTEIADELISRGFVVEKEVHLAKQAQEAKNIAAYKEAKRLKLLENAKAEPIAETKKPKSKKE